LPCLFAFLVAEFFLSNVLSNERVLWPLFCSFSFLSMTHREPRITPFFPEWLPDPISMVLFKSARGWSFPPLLVVEESHPFLRSARFFNYNMLAFPSRYKVRRVMTELSLLVYLTRITAAMP